MYTREDYENLATQAGCPDCDASADVDEYLDPCETVENKAGDVLVGFFPCDLVISLAGATLAYTDLEAHVDDGEIILKPTESFAKPAPETLSRERGYKPAKPIGKTHTWTWNDPRTDATKTNKKQWNQIMAKVQADKMQFCIITENDEVYFYRPKPEYITLDVSDGQEVGNTNVEMLTITLTAQLDKTYVVVPYQVDGVYAALKPKTDLQPLVPVAP